MMGRREATKEPVGGAAAAAVDVAAPDVAVASAAEGPALPLPNKG